MADEKFGIDTLKKMAAAVVKLGTDFGAALADKKISLGEGIELGTDVISSSDLFSQGTEIKNEFADLSEAEVIEVETYVAGILNVANEGLKEKIVKGFEFIASGYELYLTFKTAA